MRMSTEFIAPFLSAAMLALGMLLDSGPSLASSTAAQATDASGSARLQMLLRDGQWIEGRVDRMSPEGISVTKAGGGTGAAAAQIKSDDVVACLVGPEAHRSMAFLTQMSAGTLVLGDGQLLPGTFRADVRQPRWEHRWIGAIPIDTDVTAEIRLVATRRAPSRADADSILLQNGDVVVGFIDSIGEELVVERSGDDIGAAAQPTTRKDAANAAPQEAQTRRIQLDRVAAIAFAALEQPPADDALLWTTDGTIVRAKSIAFDTESGWRFVLADPNLVPQRDPKPVSGTVARPSAFLLDRSAMTPLAACEAPEHRSTESSYRYSRRPATRTEPAEQSLLGLGSIEFDGPMHALFKVPSALVGSEAVFTADIALAEPAPVDARVAVTVRLGATATETMILDSGNRRRTVRIGGRVATDSRLEIIVEDGGNGIGGDRISLRRACFIRQR